QPIGPFLVFSQANQYRCRAMEGAVLVRHAPVHVIVQEELVTRTLSGLRVALAAATRGLAAAVVVADQVVLAIMRVMASANPRDGRGRRARRAGGSCAAAARAQEPVHRAMTPVVAGVHFVFIRQIGIQTDVIGTTAAATTTGSTSHRQYGQHKGRTDH